MISADSVKARLKNIAVAEKKPFDYILTHYFTERAIYRIALSPYADNFILKGGLLLYTIFGNNARATRDIDFLAHRLNNTAENLTGVFRTIFSIEADDAVRFDINSITSENIKEGADYEGIRIKVAGYLDRTRQNLQIDVGFGDVVVPKPVLLEYPSLLDMEHPCIQAYSRESIIAEKFEAMLSLADANSRMKDFYDVFTLACLFSFDGNVLYQAVRQTLKRRKTILSSAPSVFTDDFAKSKERQLMWSAFIKRTGVAETTGFVDVMILIKSFLNPVYMSILSDTGWVKKWNKSSKQWK